MIAKWLVPVLIGLGIVLLLVHVLRSWRSAPDAVIGLQAAEAAARDERVRARAGNRPSPISATYPRAQTLLDPAEVPLDLALRELVQRYAQAGPAQRREILESLSMDDFYTLQTFAEREAVFAMRDGRRESLVTGAQALALIDPSRIDSRDAGWPLPRLHYAARKIGASVDRPLRDAAAMAVPEIRDVIDAFLALPEEEKTPESGLFADIGTGFATRMLEPYAPSRDLVSVGIAVREVLIRDRYEDADLTVGSDLPEVWFDGAARERQRIRGCLAVHATDGEAPEVFMMVFIAEAEDANAAIALRDAAVRKEQGRPTLVFVRDNVLLLAIGLEPLDRFEAPLAALLPL